MSVSQIHAQWDIANRTKWRDHRATVRYRCAPATYGRVLFDEDDDDREYEGAWLADLSLGGAGLIMIRPIEIGKRLYVLIRKPSSQELVVLQGEVIHSTAQVDGEWLVGCKFDRALTRAQ